MRIKGALQTHAQRAEAGKPGVRATPARHAAAKAQFFGRVLPQARDGGMGNKQDAVQRRPVIRTRTVSLGRRLHKRSQRLQDLPGFIADRRSNHVTHNVHGSLPGDMASFSHAKTSLACEGLPSWIDQHRSYD